MATQAHDAAALLGRQRDAHEAQLLERLLELEELKRIFKID